MALNLTVSASRHLLGVTDAKAQHGAAEQTDEQFLQAYLDKLLDSWADAHEVDAISSVQFVLRFRPAEIAAIQTAAETVPAVAALLTRLEESPKVWLSSAELSAGLDALVAGGLLTANRLDKIKEGKPR